MLFQVWHELRNILMVMILLMLYLVLWVPYIVMVKGDQVRTEKGDREILNLKRISLDSEKVGCGIDGGSIHTNVKEWLL